MAESAGLDAGSFMLEGGPVGCLLIHGLTGTPLELRPLGGFLQDRGVTVSAPLLAGHGTQPEDLNRTRWQDWLASAEEGLLALEARCTQVFLAGLSMGALLAVHLAIRHPVSGLVLYAPALRLAHRGLSLLPLIRLLKKQWPKAPEQEADWVDPDAPRRARSYATYPTAAVCQLLKLQRVTRRELRVVHAPAIVFCSTRDMVIHPSAGKLVFGRLGSVDKEFVVLHNSGHVMIVDAERDTIFARTFGFMAAHGATAR